MQYTLTRTISLIRPFNLRRKFSFKIFWILSSIAILALSTFYILQVNSLAREKFLIESYEEKLNQLSENNEILEINFAQSSSLENIGNYLQNKNFEKVSQVKYIRILESSVVKKQ